MPWLLDRLTLRPTRHAIDHGDAVCLDIEVGDASVELFLLSANDRASDSVHLVVCKFLGAGGRAENLTAHPLEYWTDLRGAVCSVNPPGFGRSQGRANLATMVTAGRRAVTYVTGRFPDAKLLLVGSSLGAAVALRIAADLAGRQQNLPSGLILRDPPQLHDVITQRFGWWTGWLPAWLVARRTPAEFDAYEAAANCGAIPALFISSRRDTIVPPNIQDRVIQSYSGPTEVVRLADANHSDPLSAAEQYEYRLSLDWLRQNLR